jgi:hypothetical protein
MVQAREGVCASFRPRSVSRDAARSDEPVLTEFAPHRFDAPGGNEHRERARFEPAMRAPADAAWPADRSCSATISKVRDVEHRDETRPFSEPRRIATFPSACLMFDMIALAFHADITRVVSFMMAAETSGMTYDHVGVIDPFHQLSHHQNDRAKIEELIQIQTYHTRVFASFVQRLAYLRDGDGSVLDRSLILYGSNMSDSHAHDHFPLPVAILGGGCGRLRGGQHVRCTDRTPQSNVLLTMLDCAGVPVESFGDSTGNLPELAAYV